MSQILIAESVEEPTSIKTTAPFTAEECYGKNETVITEIAKKVSEGLSSKQDYNTALGRALTSIEKYDGLQSLPSQELIPPIMFSEVSESESDFDDVSFAVDSFLSVLEEQKGGENCTENQDIRDGNPPNGGDITIVDPHGLRHGRDGHQSCGTRKVECQSEVVNSIERVEKDAINTVSEEKNWVAGKNAECTQSKHSTCTTESSQAGTDVHVSEVNFVNSKGFFTSNDNDVSSDTSLAQTSSFPIGPGLMFGTLGKTAEGSIHSKEDALLCGTCKSEVQALSSYEGRFNLDNSVDEEKQCAVVFPYCVDSEKKYLFRQTSQNESRSRNEPDSKEINICINFGTKSSLAEFSSLDTDNRKEDLQFGEDRSENDVCLSHEASVGINSISTSNSSEGYILVNENQARGHFVQMETKSIKRTRSVSCQTGNDGSDDGSDLLKAICKGVKIGLREILGNQQGHFASKILTGINFTLGTKTRRKTFHFRGTQELLLLQRSPKQNEDSGNSTEDHHGNGHKSSHECFAKRGAGSNEYHPREMCVNVWQQREMAHEEEKDFLGGNVDFIEKCEKQLNLKFVPYLSTDHTVLNVFPAKAELRKTKKKKREGKHETMEQEDEGLDVELNLAQESHLSLNIAGGCDDQTAVRAKGRLIVSKSGGSANETPGISEPVAAQENGNEDIEMPKKKKRKKHKKEKADGNKHKEVACESSKPSDSTQISPSTSALIGIVQGEEGNEPIGDETSVTDEHNDLGTVSRVDKSNLPADGDNAAVPSANHRGCEMSVKDKKEGDHVIYDLQSRKTTEKRSASDRDVGFGPGIKVVKKSRKRKIVDSEETVKQMRIKDKKSSKKKQDSDGAITASPTEVTSPEVSIKPTSKSHKKKKTSAKKWVHRESSSDVEETSCIKVEKGDTHHGSRNPLEHCKGLEERDYEEMVNPGIDMEPTSKHKKKRKLAVKVVQKGSNSDVVDTSLSYNATPFVKAVTDDVRHKSNVPLERSKSSKDGDDGEIMIDQEIHMISTSKSKKKRKLADGLVQEGSSSVVIDTSSSDNVIPLFKANPSVILSESNIPLESSKDVKVRENGGMMGSCTYPEVNMLSKSKKHKKKKFSEQLVHDGSSSNVMETSISAKATPLITGELKDASSVDEVLLDCSITLLPPPITRKIKKPSAPDAIDSKTVKLKKKKKSKKAELDEEGINLNLNHISIERLFAGISSANFKENEDEDIEGDSLTSEMKGNKNKSLHSTKTSGGSVDRADDLWNKFGVGTSSKGLGTDEFFSGEVPRKDKKKMKKRKHHQEVFGVSENITKDSSIVEKGEGRKKQKKISDLPSTSKESSKNILDENLFLLNPPPATVEDSSHSILLAHSEDLLEDSNNSDSKKKRRKEKVSARNSEKSVKAVLTHDSHLSSSQNRSSNVKAEKKKKSGQDDLVENPNMKDDSTNSFLPPGLIPNEKFQKMYKEKINHVREEPGIASRSVMKSSADVLDSPSVLKPPKSKLTQKQNSSKVSHVHNSARNKLEKSRGTEVTSKSGKEEGNHEANEEEVMSLDQFLQKLEKERRDCNEGSSEKNGKNLRILNQTQERKKSEKESIIKIVGPLNDEERDKQRKKWTNHVATQPEEEVTLPEKLKKETISAFISASTRKKVTSRPPTVPHDNADHYFIDFPSFPDVFTPRSSKTKFIKRHKNLNKKGHNKSTSRS